MAATIDPDKLRAALRKMRSDRLYLMLDDAIGLLPPAKLAKLAGRHLNVENLRPSTAPKPGGLLAGVKAFDKASRAQEYYESFNVNSKNFSEQSKGTCAWIAECLRLLDA